MSGIVGHLGSKSRVIGFQSPASGGVSNTLPQFSVPAVAGQDQSPDEGVMISVSKGDGGNNVGRFGSYKVFSGPTSAGRISLEPIYYGSYFIIVGDNGAYRFVDIVVSGMTTFHVLHSLQTMNDGGTSAVTRTYSGDSKLNLAMASSFKLSIFEFHGYPTAS